MSRKSCTRKERKEELEYVACICIRRIESTNNLQADNRQQRQHAQPTPKTEFMQIESVFEMECALLYSRKNAANFPMLLTSKVNANHYSYTLAESERTKLNMSNNNNNKPFRNNRISKFRDFLFENKLAHKVNSSHEIHGNCFSVVK